MFDTNFRERMNRMPVCGNALVLLPTFSKIIPPHVGAGNFLFLLTYLSPFFCGFCCAMGVPVESTTVI